MSLKYNLLRPLCFFVAAIAFGQSDLHFYKPHVIVPAKTTLGGANASRCDPSQPNGKPCFAGNSDVLKGRRTLLAVDDVQIVGIFGQQPGAVLDGSKQLTSNSAITSSTNSNIASAIAGQQLPPTLNTFLSTSMVAAHLFSPTGAHRQQSSIQGIYGISRNNNREINVACDNNDGAGNVLAAQEIGDRLPNDDSDLFANAVHGDFSGFGTEDVVFGNYNVLSTVFATDPNDQSKGVQIAFPATDLPDINNQPQKILSMAVGHFGQAAPLSIAVLSSGGKDFGSGGLYLQFLAIHNHQLEFVTTQPISINVGNQSIRGAALDAGHFVSTSYDQLAISYVKSDGSQFVQTIDFGADGTLHQTAAPDSIISNGRQYVQLKKGHFDLGSGLDQAVLFNWTGDASSSYQLTYLSFSLEPDTYFHIAPNPTVNNFGDPICAYSMQVGNFDHQTPSSGSIYAGPDLRDQVAVLSASTNHDGACDTAGYDLAIYNVGRNNKNNIGNMPNPSHRTIAHPDGYTSVQSLTLAPIDIQGRSKLLGDPKVLVFNSHKSPQVILAAPPTHIDALPSDGGSGPLEVFNFTATPAAYYGGFDQTGGGAVSTNSKKGSTYSFSAEETLDAKYSVGLCDPNGPQVCVSGEDKASAKQTRDDSLSTDDASTQESSHELTVSTTNSIYDQVIFDSSSFSVYLYPVLGETTCSPNPSPCTQPNQKYVQVAVSDSHSDIESGNNAAPGATLDWYQPVWMAGNLLSYPANACQFEVAVVGSCNAGSPAGSQFQQLTASTTFTLAGSGSDVTRATWNTNSSHDSTTAFNANFSFDNTLTASGALDDELESSKVSFTLDLAGSFGLSTLIENRTELSASQGLTYNIESSFSQNPVYTQQSWNYTIEPLIFGLHKPSGVIDDKASNYSSDSQFPPQPDLTAYGPLRSGFIAAPANPGQGIYQAGWYSQHPDIGLNQPERWAVKNAAFSGNNCVIAKAGDSNAVCASLSASGTQPLFQDPRHNLRGLFISGDQLGGPQILNYTLPVPGSNAKPIVFLNLRVYNFSTAQTNGAMIHARFYAFSGDTQQSDFLGEATAKDINPWDPNSNEPNWSLLNISFDPTKYANENIFFWVLVFSENNGVLQPDLGGHGLKSIPPTNIQYADAQGYEEPYSNNLGFYHTPLFIGVPSSPSAVSAANVTSAEIVEVATQHTFVKPDQDNIAAVRVLVTGSDINTGLTINIYDGLPSGGGQIVRSFLQSHFTAGRIYEFQANLATQVAGTHKFYVSLGEGTRLSHTVEFRKVDVVTKY